MAVHLALASDVFDGVLFFVLSFSWMRSGTELNQFLRIFHLFLTTEIKKSPKSFFLEPLGSDARKLV